MGVVLKVGAGATQFAVAEKREAARPAPTIVQVLLLWSRDQRIIDGESLRSLLCAPVAQARPSSLRVRWSPRKTTGGGPGKGRGRTADVASPRVLQPDLKKYGAGGRWSFPREAPPPPPFVSGVN